MYFWGIIESDIVSTPVGYIVEKLKRPLNIETKKGGIFIMKLSVMVVEMTLISKPITVREEKTL